MNKQIIQSKTSFIEKVIRDKEGRLVRATFCVYENAGRIKARLVEYVYITAGAISGKVLSLTGTTSSQNSLFNIHNSVRRTPSPYFNKESLYFSGSKPRAPTFI